jgi:hypothetical protein
MGDHQQRARAAEHAFEGQAKIFRIEGGEACGTSVVALTRHFRPVEIGRSLLVDSGNARHSHPARVSTPKSSCGARARQSELDSRHLAAVS